jgi:hypothetical protein
MNRIPPPMGRPRPMRRPGRHQHSLAPRPLPPAAPAPRHR